MPRPSTTSRLGLAIGLATIAYLGVRWWASDPDREVEPAPKALEAKGASAAAAPAAELTERERLDGRPADPPDRRFLQFPDDVRSTVRRLAEEPETALLRCLVSRVSPYPLDPRTTAFEEVHVIVLDDAKDLRLEKGDSAKLYYMPRDGVGLHFPELSDERLFRGRPEHLVASPGDECTFLVRKRMWFQNHILYPGECRAPEPIDVWGPARPYLYRPDHSVVDARVVAFSSSAIDGVAVQGLELEVTRIWWTAGRVELGTRVRVHNLPEQDARSLIFSGSGFRVREADRMRELVFVLQHGLRYAAVVKAYRGVVARAVHAVGSTGESK